MYLKKIILVRAIFLLIEEMLVESDIGYDLTQEILKSIRKNKGDELKKYFEKHFNELLANRHYRYKK